MNRTFTLLVIGILLASSSIEQARAQVDLEGSLTGMYDDNINNNHLRISDKVSTVNLNTGYGLEFSGWRTRLSYDGILNYYQTVSERTNQFHSGNLGIVHYSGEDEENVLSIGGSFGQGFYRGDYSFYNHSLLSVGVNYKHFLSEHLINKVGYTFRSVSFADLGDFSYSEHLVSGSLSGALATSTTVIVQTDLGTKFYSAASPSEGTGGMRKGKMSIAPSVAQAVGTMRIGQSIFDGTGLSLTTRYQWNILKQTRYLSSNYGSISDDELFDDHYGYEGMQTSLTLTQVISESMLLKVTGGIQDRTYSSLAAYDLGGNIVADTRTDRRSYASVFFQKDFDPGLRLKFAYDLIRNASNDAFYDYWNNAVTLELTVPF